MADVPQLAVGQKDIGKLTWKYATAISPASRKEIGRVRNPRVNAAPTYVSNMPARWNSHIGGTTGIAGTWAGIGGKPNSFIVPVTTKTSPATIRRMLNILPVHGDRDGSNIDMYLPIWLRLEEEQHRSQSLFRLRQRSVEKRPHH